MKDTNTAAAAAPEETSTPGGFYEQKGMVRHMLILHEAHKLKLKRIAKTYNLTQGEVIEVFLDQMNIGQISTHLEAKRSAKEGGRTSKSAIIAKMVNLSAEQLSAIEAIIASGKV